MNNNMNHSISKDSQSGSNKNERFARLYEKVANIQSNEVQNVATNKFSKLEQKVNEVEENLLSNIDALEMKYSLLKDQIAKFTKIVEEEKQSKEKLKSKSNEEIKALESRIKNMINEERENNKNYIDDCVKRIESQIQNFEKNSKNENENIHNTLNTMKEYMEVRII